MSEYRGALDRPIVDKKSMWRATDLFYHEFTEGEDIVVETDNGMMHVGRLVRTRDDEHLIVQVSTKRRVEIAWEEIIFVAHAGFPVRAISKMTPAQAEDFAQQFDTDRCRTVLLELLQREVVRPSSTVAVAEKQYPRRLPPFKPVTLRGGCPFDFEDVRIVALNNPGNDTLQWWGSGNEEELVLRARDGALCLSYNLGHMFYLETDGISIGMAA